MYNSPSKMPVNPKATRYLGPVHGKKGGSRYSPKNKRQVTLMITILSVIIAIFLIIPGCKNPLNKFLEEDEQNPLDTTAPVITVFTLTNPNPVTSRDITFTLAGSDDITGWLINETEIAPAYDAGGWLSELPTGYQLSDGDGEKTVYAWAKDETGNVSNSASFTLDLYTSGPTISFTLTSTTPTSNPTITFDLSGDAEVTGWYISETGTNPDPGDAGWVDTAPTGYTFPAVRGPLILYAWGKTEGDILSVMEWIQITLSIPDESMSGVGRSPQIITLNFYDNPLIKHDASGSDQLSNHIGKIILLSFINLGDRPHTDLPVYWELLSKLEEIKDAINTFRTTLTTPPDFQVLAVVQNYGNNSNLISSVSALSTAPDYPVFRDANSVAEIYRNAFLSSNDNCFPASNLVDTKLGSEIWSFIIDEKMIITDKWNNMCTSNSPKDLLSFHNLTTLLFPTFNSTDLDNMSEFTIERIKDLLLPPRILSTNPASGDTITLSPSLTVEVTFSKPVGIETTDGMGYPLLDKNNIELTANFPIAGEGGIELETTYASYENNGLAVSDIDRIKVGAIENAVTLTVENTTTPGTLHPGTVILDINNNPVLAERIKDLLDIELPILTNTEAITYNEP